MHQSLEGPLQTLCFLCWSQFQDDIGPIGFLYYQVNDTGSWEPLVMYFTLHRLLRKLIKEVGIVNSLCKLTCTPTNWQKKEEILDNHVGFLFPWNSHTQLDAQLYKCSNNVYIAGSVNCSTNLFSNYLFCLTFLSTWVHNSFFSWVRVVQSSVVVYCLFMFYLQFLITPLVSSNFLSISIQIMANSQTADGHTRKHQFDVYSIQHYEIKFVWQWVTCDSPVIFAGYSGFLHQ